MNQMVSTRPLRRASVALALETDPMRIRCATDGCKFWTSINQTEGELSRASPRP